MKMSLMTAYKTVMKNGEEQLYLTSVEFVIVIQVMTAYKIVTECGEVLLYWMSVGCVMDLDLQKSL